MEGHRTVGEEGLDFCDEKIAFFEERPHLELVAFQFPALERIAVIGMQTIGMRLWTYLDASWEVDGGQHQDCVLSRAGVDLPSSRLHLRPRESQKGCVLWKSAVLTSVIRPTTRSPTSGLYLCTLAAGPVAEERQGARLPRTGGADGDELIYALDSACDGSNDLVVVNVRTMAAATSGSETIWNSGSGTRMVRTA